MDNTTYSTTVQARATSDPTSNLVSPVETHDGETLNPSGRVPLEGEESGSKLVKCGKPVIFSTLNARTLKKTGRIDELILCAKQNNIDIISIQEHRHYHPDLNLKYQKFTDFPGYQLITSSALKNQMNSTIGGVGFLLSPKASSNLLHVEKISDNIIIAEFSSNPKTTLICCYSPHNTRPESEVDDFYHKLRSVASDVPAHNLLLFLGDFNAKLGPTDALFTYNNLTNRNGEKMLDFMTEFELVATNTRFMNSRNKLWTFEYPTGSKAQLDYILVRRKWINSVRNCRAYSSSCSVLSDHRIVSANISQSPLFKETLSESNEGN